MSEPTLVARLRYADIPKKNADIHHLLLEAADLIDSQQATITELRADLKKSGTMHRKSCEHIIRLRVLGEEQ